MSKKITFIDNNGTFTIDNPEKYSGLYLPMAGEQGLKSAITPMLGGDAKTDQNHFLMEPVSIENLHNNRSTRNFWCVCDECAWSVCGSSATQEAERFTANMDESRLEAGFMWQKLTRISKKNGLKAETTSFVTVDGLIEVMRVDITNISESNITFRPVGAYPIYGRSADNIRDHRHVTSLLHRIVTNENGIVVKPVLSFDERGHQRNNTMYFVYGFSGDDKKPHSYYPTVDSYIGEGGTYTNPTAIRNVMSDVSAGEMIEGKEAFGGINFDETVIRPKEVKTYTIIAGIAENESMLSRIEKRYLSSFEIEKAYEKVREYWTDKVNVTFRTGDSDIDNYLKWICFQPILRRIYGCSFLPYHDYGKGGRGWRDLWQDCLALLIMEPSNVRRMIVSNYGGVRIDGTNATIIGSEPGEFIADRNNIARVWMDHAYWPFLTTRFYIDQTGDIDVLFENTTYFKDKQVMRGTQHDDKWNDNYGNMQKIANGDIYHGTVIEHILLQNLCQFYDVGEHNEMYLHGADWNDALDMAWDSGESVAFTCAYAGNLKSIAQTLEDLERISGINRIEIIKEAEYLLKDNEKLYENPFEKKKLLEEYANLCRHNISGEKIIVRISQLRDNLLHKAEWLMKNIREHEWIEETENIGWFNGYYDNSKKAVEYYKTDDVRMMLTSQVFAIMSGTASEKQIASICKSADKYLYDEKAGGYRLNTNFKEEKFDLGRMFGFAYGEKENGAVFSHMTVMYANALYKRGFVKEGYKALKALLDAARDFDKSVMYPGLPEYYNNNGRGMYAYLTGAASWYMLTMITQVYGVRGELGNLVIQPKLMQNQYDSENKSELKLRFAERKLRIIFHNENNNRCGIKTEDNNRSIRCDIAGAKIIGDKIVINREYINKFSKDNMYDINVYRA